MTSLERALGKAQRERAHANPTPVLDPRGAVAEAGAASAPANRTTRSERALVLLRTALGSERAPAWILALALLSAAPALWVGFDSDDRFQVASLEDSGIAGIARAPWDLYAFAKDRASNAGLREEGVFPWWADVDARIAFFRPLTSLSRWLDQTLWPDRIPLMQLHSLLWFALLLATVARVYRQLSPSRPWVFGLSLALFALDDVHTASIAWLCHRNTLIALSFGFGALLAHHRWRTRGSRSAAWLGPLCLALALAGGEAALQACAYLLAYALFLERGPLRTRLTPLMPYAGVVLAWAVVYKLLGYGAQGSAFYLDPLQQPLTFARLLPERMLIYGLGLFEGVPGEWMVMLPALGVGARAIMVPIALVAALSLAAALGPLFRRDPLVRFWSAGTVMALVPACGVMPCDRLLPGAAVGGMALVASLLAAVVDKTYPAPRPWVVAFAAMLALVNLAFAPLIRAPFVAMADDFDEQLARADASIPRTPEIARETLILLNPPTDQFGIFFSLYRATEDIPRPERVRWLATGASSLQVERVDARTLKLTPSAGFLPGESAQVLRSLDRPLRVGDELALSDLSFEVLSHTPDGRPKEVLARFPEPLESPRYRWVEWGKHEYVPFRPPAIGGSILVPAVDIIETMLGF